ncbi:MAG TPA: oxidoreductase [Firmicutes bacterium]|nr:oxidoreductase [Bacillota bacterium]
MSRNIRFGVVGTNNITDRFLAAAKLNPHFEFTAVYSRTEERGREFANKYGVEHVFTDLLEFGSSDVIDAIYIASPNVCHAEQAILFIENGKHVICEKPLASNLSEVTAMFEAAKKHNVLLMEAMKTTLLPNFQVIKDNLHKIGTIRHYFASFCQYSSRYDAYKAGTVLNAFKPELSNGALVDIGVYTLAPMVQLFGLPQHIKASAYLLESGVDGKGSISCNYKEFEATTIYSKISNSYLPSEIQGENGSIIINKMNEMNDVKIIYRNGEVETISLPQEKEDMVYEVNEFISCLLNGCTESRINSKQFSYELMSILDECRKQFGLIYPADQK